VIKEQSGLFGVSQAFKAAGVKLPYRQGAGSILGKSEVYLGNNNIP
jgi:hypothetical protein